MIKEKIIEGKMISSYEYNELSKDCLQIIIRNYTINDIENIDFIDVLKESENIFIKNRNIKFIKITSSTPSSIYQLKTIFYFLNTQMKIDSCFNVGFFGNNLVLIAKDLIQPINDKLDFKKEHLFNIPALATINFTILFS